MNENNEYLNRVEKTKKSLEKVFSCPVSYHEEGGWNGKNGHFIIKLNTEIMGNKKWLSCHEEKEKFVLTPIKKFADGLEKVLDNTQPYEKIFCGLSEVIPFGKERGEAEFVTYFEKAEDNKELIEQGKKKEKKNWKK